MAAPRCPGCAGSLVEITLSIDGDDVTMRSCSTCDRRSWHRGGLSLPLAGVLAAAGRRASHRAER